MPYQVKGYILGYQKRQVQLLLDNFDNRIPEIPTFVKFRHALDFRKMSMLPAHHEQFEKHGEDAIEWLVKERYPDLDNFTTQNEYLKVCSSSCVVW